MSRNLCMTHCNDCPAPRVFLVEPPRLATEDDCGRYYKNHVGLLVANAECALCGAKYLAWVDDRECDNGRYGSRFDAEREYYDLSYRSTFNDEPGPDDLPRFEVEAETTYARTRAITYCHHQQDVTGDCWWCKMEARTALAQENGDWSVFWVPKDGSEPKPCQGLENYASSP